MRSNVPITRLGKFFGDRDFELEVEMEIGRAHV